MKNLPPQTSDLIEDYVKKILWLIDGDGRSSPTPKNIPKELRFKVPENTTEVLIFAIGNDDKLSAHDEEIRFSKDGNNYSFAEIYRLNVDADTDSMNVPVGQIELDREHESYIVLRESCTQLEESRTELEESCTCTFCKLTFQTVESLTEHYRQFKYASHYLCVDCTTVFSSLLDYAKHSETIHGKGLTCKICNKLFPSDESLKMHGSTHILNAIDENAKIVFGLQCVACKRNCKTLRALRKHKCRNPKKDLKKKEKIRKVRKVDLKRKHYAVSCDECSRTFLHSKALNVHKILAHTNFRCKKCGARHASADELKSHAEKGCLKGGTCSHCGKVYNKFYKLRRHMAKHQPERTFHCKLCKCSFFSDISLNVHLKTHQKQYLCHVCSKTFTYKFHLSRHLKAHANGTIKTLKSVEYHCVLCPQFFPAAATLRLHYATDHTIPSYNCVTCKERFSTHFQLQSHFGRAHQGLRSDLCRFCGDVFVDDKKAFKVHTKAHEVDSFGVPEYCTNGASERPYLYRCTICAKKFVTHKSLLCHHQVHYSHDAFGCSFCEERFTSAGELDEHVATHDEDVEVDKCSICGKYVANMQLHSRNTHSSKKHYCNNCSVSFASKSDLTSHSCLNADGEPFQCTECNATFDNFDNLQKHGRSHGHGHAHSQVTKAKFSCSECKRKFITRTSLFIHLYGMLKNQCREEKQFRCRFCDRQFNSKSNLSNHLRTHNSEKPSLKKLFSCDKCNKTFSTKAHQIIHTQTHDSDRLMCPVCYKSMTTLPSLQMHMRTHTGECPTCPVCSKRFVTPKTLREHMFTHKGERPRVSCSLCDNVFACQRDCLAHLKNYHSELSPGVCDKCGVGFLTAQQLAEHASNCVLQESGHEQNIWSTTVVTNNSFLDENVAFEILT